MAKVGRERGERGRQRPGEAKIVGRGSARVRHSYVHARHRRAERTHDRTVHHHRSSCCSCCCQRASISLRRNHTSADTASIRNRSPVTPTLCIYFPSSRPARAACWEHAGFSQSDPAPTRQHCLTRCHSAVY